MKKIFFICFLIVSEASFSQNALKLDSLNEKARTFIHKNLDSVDFYLDIIFDAIDTTVFDAQHAEAVNILSIKLMQQGQFDSSLYHLRANLNRYHRMGDEKGLASTNGNIGNIYRIKGDNLSAIKYLLVALKFFEKTGFKEAIGGTRLNIGIIYSRLDRYQDAIEYYEYALETFKELENLRMIASCQISLGNAFKDIGNYEQAIAYQRKALKNSRTSDNITGIADAYGNLGEVYLLLQEYDSVIKNTRLAIKHFHQLQDSVKLSVANVNLALAHYHKGDIKAALEDAEMATRIAYKKDYLLSKERISNVLMNIYADLGDYESAFKQAIIHLEARDSVYDNDKSSAIARLEASYEYDKKEAELKQKQAEKEFALQQRNQRNLIASIGGGVIILVIAIFIYVQYRQRNKYAKIVEEKNVQLSETMASKEKLFSVIAHDLKSPLSAFSSMSSTLAENIDAFPKDKIVTYLKKFDQSSQNLSELLNNLLQWSLSQTGSLSVHPEELDIKQSMQNAIRPLTDLAETRDIKLSLKGDNTKVQADGKMVETVVRNLVSNALKFTENGGEVEVHTVKKQDEVLVSIKDSGIGMEENEIAQLFDLRYDPSRIGDHEAKGTGLGLILSKELVEKNNGTIGVTSEKGKGSTFYFTLPIAA